jgi:ribonuclease Z
MRPFFHPALLNDPFGDPGVFVDCIFTNRALLFDLGDLRNMPGRKLLRVSDVFVTHAHMDHFFGFDHLLRLTLGRGKTIRLFGPKGFIQQVEHKLLGYTWNLVHHYAEDLQFEVIEVYDENHGKKTIFSCRAQFARLAESTLEFCHGILLDETFFQIKVRVLDHFTPCLAFCLEEKVHVNIWKNELEKMGLPTGPWLTELKKKVLEKAPDDTTMTIVWRQSGSITSRTMPLSTLKKAVCLTKGQKIAYITDVRYTPHNIEKIVQFADHSDLLFIETPFLQEDYEKAAKKGHLTTEQAATIAERIHARQVIPFHFSPAHHAHPERFYEELHALLTKNQLIGGHHASHVKYRH